ncbi:MAG: hypothetical protein IPK85_05930 [Gemmatimonadetes bacterium]|nr:hypothetical protein [Gemmatimonadota bacterium]
MNRYLFVVALAGCARGEPAADEGARRAEASGDSTFAAVQDRGAVAMGVDQYTSTHHFTPLPNGGLIELQRDSIDPTGITQIRAHMREIATAFAAGDFTLPGMVHAQVVPGTETMAARRSTISYVAEELPKGAQVRITTTDSVALKAVHEFLAFQRQDHHAGMRHDD